MNRYLIVFILGVCISSFSQILLKISASKERDSIIKEYLNGYVIIGYSMFFMAMFMAIYAFKGINLKNAPVLESISYGIVLILSSIILNEKITKRKIIGNIIIFIGIIVFYL